MLVKVAIIGFIVFLIVGTIAIWLSDKHPKISDLLGMLVVLAGGVLFIWVLVSSVVM